MNDTIPSGVYVGIKRIVLRRIESVPHKLDELYKKIDADRSVIKWSINHLVSDGLIYEHNGMYYCTQNSPRDRPLVKAEPAEEIPAMKPLTITVTPGLFNDLRKYAKAQGSSIEAEAVTLLGDIVRTYKMTNVIPA